MVFVASSSAYSCSCSFFCLFNFPNRKHSFQTCPSDFLGFCILHQVQTFEAHAEEEEEDLWFNFNFFPVFSFPEAFETNWEESSTSLDVSISIRRCLTSTYVGLSFVVRLSTTLSWFLIKKPNKISLLALSSFRNAAKVSRYQLEAAFESFVRRSHCDSCLDIKPGKSVPEFWVGKETRFIIWVTNARAESR